MQRETQCKKGGWLDPTLSEDRKYPHHLGAGENKRDLRYLSWDPACLMPSPPSRWLRCLVGPGLLPPPWRPLWVVVRLRWLV